MSIFSKIGSAFGLIVQVILVVLAVLVFSYFDPFRIFGPSEPTLEDTPVSIKSIKSIGQLISAEYYGEVIVSLKGKYLEDIEEESDSIGKKYSMMAVDFYEAVEAMKTQEGLKIKGFNQGRKIKKYFHDTYPDICNDPEYNAFVESLQELLGEKNETNLLRRLYKDKIELDTLKLDSTSFKRIREEELNSVYADKLHRKKQLVILGRGSVKAGFDFKDFNEDNFRYDERHQTIYFIGLAPKILSASINPWFIPEKGVKGFEIILASSKSSPQHVKEAKAEALQKLLEQAYLRDILNQAQTNAAENLKKFFSLILDAEVREVVFMNSELDYSLKTIAEDSLITGDELLRIDSLIKRHDRTKPKVAAHFMTELGKIPVSVFGTNTSLEMSYYGGLVYYLVKDEAYTYQDFSALQKEYYQLDSITWKDSVWFSKKGKLDSAKTFSAKKAAFEEAEKWIRLATDTSMQAATLPSEMID